MNSKYLGNNRIAEKPIYDRQNTENDLYCGTKKEVMAQHAKDGSESMVEALKQSDIAIKLKHQSKGAVKKFFSGVFSIYHRKLKKQQKKIN